MEPIDFGKPKEHFLVATLILKWIILFNSNFKTSVLFKPDSFSGLLGAPEAHHNHLYHTRLVIMKSVWSVSVSNGFSLSPAELPGPSVEMM